MTSGVHRSVYFEYFIVSVISLQGPNRLKANGTSWEVYLQIIVGLQVNQILTHMNGCNN